MMRRRGGLVRVAATTAVVAGTAGAVSHHQQQKYADQDAAAQEQYAPPPGPPMPSRPPEPSAGLHGRARAAVAAEGAGDHHGRGVRGEEEADPRALAALDAVGIERASPRRSRPRGRSSEAPRDVGSRPARTCLSSRAPRPDRDLAAVVRPRRGCAPTLFAAIAVWAVLVPQAVGYAAIAGAPPQAGLFAALGAGVLYAIFGTCRELDVGPSSTIAVTAAAVLVAGRGRESGRRLRRAARGARACSPASCSPRPALLRLGFVAEFLARPVLLGFISGIGIVIAVGQLPSLLGITDPSTPGTCRRRSGASVPRSTSSSGGRR